MNFVLDSSFALTWLLKDEATEETEAALDTLGRGATALVPALWRWEISNALLSVERQKRATWEELSRQLIALQNLPIEIDAAASDQAWSVTHSLARQHRLTCYDAAYLEISMRRNLPLASLDGALIAAAKLEKVRLLGRV